MSRTICEGNPKDGAVAPPVAIRNERAKQRHEVVDEFETVNDECRIVLGFFKDAGDIDHQDGKHPVIAKTLSGLVADNEIMNLTWVGQIGRCGSLCDVIPIWGWFALGSPNRKSQQIIPQQIPRMHPANSWQELGLRRCLRSRVSAKLPRR